MSKNVVPSLKSASTGAPSLARYGVLALLCALAFVLYIDRVCIGQAATFMQADLGISNTQWGIVMGAFTWPTRCLRCPPATGAIVSGRGGCCCGSYCGGRCSLR